MFLKHFILAGALPPKEIIITVLLTLMGEIANNKASWTDSISSFETCTHN